MIGRKVLRKEKRLDTSKILQKLVEDFSEKVSSNSKLAVLVGLNPTHYLITAKGKNICVVSTW